MAGSIITAMNVYLDIDGVILGMESPLEDAIEFLMYLLENYPSNTYWLTTHVKDGENNTNHSLAGVYPDELVSQMYDVFKATDWGTLKTDAIDFSQPFVWFDDTLFTAEKQVLEQNGALGSYYKMDPSDKSALSKALNYLKSGK